MLPQLKLSKGRADCSAPREEPEQRFPLHAGQPAARSVAAARTVGDESVVGRAERRSTV